MPQGDEWLHEIKFDGYRVLCRIENKRAIFLTREAQDWTGRFGALVEAAQRLPVHQAFLDGEVVALEENGKTNFQLLQNSLKQNNPATLVYFVFDLLYLDGWDLTHSPLEDRKKLLKQILKQKRASKVLGPQLRYSEHWIGQGDDLYQESCRKGLEGIISKRRISLTVRGEAGTGSRSNAPRTRSSSSAASRNPPDHVPAWERSWWVCMIIRVSCFTPAGSEPDSPNKASRNCAHGSIHSSANRRLSSIPLKAQMPEAFTG